MTVTGFSTADHPTVVTTDYYYNKNNELLSTKESHLETKRTNYHYDLNGNELSRTKSELKEGTPDDINDYELAVFGEAVLDKDSIKTYDVLNQLESSTNLDTNTESKYEYNEAGLRTRKTVKSEGQTKTTKYVWDGDQIILELDEDNDVTKRYVRGLNLIYSEDINLNNQSQNKQYFVYNAHGDVVQLMQADGTVSKTYKYDSFGNEINPSESDTNPYRYSGEYFDKETGAIYLRARYYDPEIGRFITEDSYTGEENDPLSLNLYTYCHNDGVNNVDPSGHWGKNFHKKITTSIANDIGFPLWQSMIIGQGSYLADTKVKKKSVWEILYENPVSKVIIDENTFDEKIKTVTSKDKKGEKLDIHLCSIKEYKKISMIVLKKYFKLKKVINFDDMKKGYRNNTTLKLLVLGIGCHIVQDRWAHKSGSGESLKHSHFISKKRKDADNYNVDWNGNRYIKRYGNKGKNSRVNNSIYDTIDYLKLAFNKGEKSLLSKKRNEIYKRALNSF